ncbi:MAG TPA: AAA domain-containing protein [Spirochaetia bacterium]|nr:AAA domain-containing protein [Spirochaetia bacterium]
MEDLSFDKVDATAEKFYPFQVTCFSIEKKGVDTVSRAARVPFAPIRQSIARSSRRSCLVERRRNRKEPGGPDVYYLHVPFDENEQESFGASWLRLYVKPDAKASLCFFGMGANLETDVRGMTEQFDLDLRLNDSSMAFGLSEQPVAYAICTKLNEIDLAPEADLASREDLKSLWGTYIDALEHLSRQKMIIFKIDEVSDELMDEKSGLLVKNVVVDYESFIADNVDRDGSFFNRDDLEPQNIGKLGRSLWQIVGREDFSVLEEVDKKALDADLKNPEGGRREMRGTRFARLEALDWSERRLVFRARGDTDEEEEDEGPDYTQVKSGNYLIPARLGELSQINRMRAAFNDLLRGKLLNAQLSQCLMDASTARPSLVPPENSDDYAAIRRGLLQKNINEEQLQAVLKALYAPDLALIQGPPGTGKTTVIAELIHQMLLLNPDARILLSSQSHLAVDNALEKLRGDPNIRPIRIAASKEARQSLETEGTLYLEERIDTWVEAGSGPLDPGDNAVARGFSDRLESLSEIAEREPVVKEYCTRARRDLSRVDREILRDNYFHKVNVVAATCSECGRRDFRDKWVKEAGFDMVVVDEVSKASPPELFVPLVHGRKAVLIGDHRQLPPMIEEDLIEKRLEDIGATDIEQKLELLKESLFEILFENADSSIKETLRKQYRMHGHIQRAIEQFYVAEGGLQSGLDPNLIDAPDLNLIGSRYHGLQFGTVLSPKDHILWIDVRGTEQQDRTSLYNEEEVDAVADVVRMIAASPGWESFKAHERVDPEIGIITFYSAQRRKLAERLRTPEFAEKAHFRIRAVDRFQGMEKDIVIVSLVRSGTAVNQDGSRGRNRSMGFAKDYRRINVAFSRARRLLVIVGNQEHFSRNAMSESVQYYQNIHQIVSNLGGDRDASQIASALDRGGAL